MMATPQTGIPSSPCRVSPFHSPLPGLQASSATPTQGLEGLGFSLAQIPDKGFHGHYSQFLCTLLPPPGHASQPACCLGPEAVWRMGRSVASDCSPPSSSVHGILQAWILEWEAIPFSRGISLAQGLNPGLPHRGQIFLPSEPPAKPVREGKRHARLLIMPEMVPHRSLPHPLWERSGSQEADSSVHFKTAKLALELSPDTIGYIFFNSK